MASRTISLAALVVLLATMGGATARKYPEYHSPPPSTYPPTEQYPPAPSPSYELPTEEYPPAPSPSYELPTEQYPPAPSPSYEAPTEQYPSAPSPSYETPTQYPSAPSPSYELPTEQYPPAPSPSYELPTEQHPPAASPSYEPATEQYPSPPPPTYEPPTEYYPPPSPPEYKSPNKYYPPSPKSEHPTSYDPNCQEYADECDFKFLHNGVPTFELIARGDNVYNPIIVDKYNYPTKVLNPNGKCTMYDSYGYDDDCRDNFYFQHNHVATRTFNIRPVDDFMGKCIRLDITSAQLWDTTNLNPDDGNKVYPEDRRCVVFRTK